MKRRKFLKQSGIIAVAASVKSTVSLASAKANTNPLPKWKGFNLLDFYSPDPAKAHPITNEEHFKWMRDWGFDFVRIPVPYPFYLNIDRTKNIVAEDAYKIDQQGVDKIAAIIELAHKHDLHTSLNLHRAPGYCINAGFNEPFNLWKDESAQQAFNFHWNMWAKLYKNVSNKRISFDLVNEPSMREDMNDQHSKSGPVPGDVYYKVAKGAVEAIRRETPDRLVIADGNSGGNFVIPELIPLNIAQSCRGYNPASISHFKAPWANKDPEHMPVPTWPEKKGDQVIGRDMLEKFYQPWVDLTKKGVGVHCGECGCWKETPHDVFLAWFNDVLDILSSNNIGFAPWNFIGDFGILNSGRKDVAYEDWHGYKLDRKMLQLLQKY
jgi:aryl-phospho-beta-D-glucosidase BglC (GH1 family)